MHSTQAWNPWNKGLTKETDERVKKMSEANKGKKFSKETRRKISEAMKGNKNALGRIVSEETRRKLSVINRGKRHSEKSKRKMSESKKGRIGWNRGLTKETDERIRNISEGHKGNKHHFYGKTFSEEHKRKISVGLKGNKNSSGHIRSAETRRKISEALSGKKSYLWQGGKSFEPYPSAFNNSLKRRMRIRDKNTCQLCGKNKDEIKRNLSIHHIDYDKNNCEEWNLVALCRGCNGKVNLNRKYWESYFSALLLERGEAGS